MRYFLLLKRLIKKKSYIVMLLIVPLVVLLLNAMSGGESGLLTIGVYIPGEDYSSIRLRNNITETPGSLRFIFYDDENVLIEDVEGQRLAQSWICPDNLDDLIEQMAISGGTKDKIEILVREDGLSAMLGREVLCSRIYPLVARQMAKYYISEILYDSNPTDIELNHILDTYDSYEINGNLFEMGYVDGAIDESDTSYLLMPLRGILALWLLLLSIAASMYYIEDERNGLFIWWKPRFRMGRDFLYYAVIMIVPTIMVLIGLYLGGVFTTFSRELLTIALYDISVIALSSVLRLIIRSIMGLGIITPLIILSSAILSPVFIDFKEARALQRFCPTFHYLYSIHDTYFVQSLVVMVVELALLWVILHRMKLVDKCI